MKNIVIFAVISALFFNASAQTFRLADPTGHYKEFEKIDPSAKGSREWMDTVTYPPSEYGSSIVYLLVKPYYLNDRQVQSLSGSIKPPANSSDQVRRELDYLLELQRNRSPEQIKRVEFLGDIGYWPSVNLIANHPHYEQNLRDLFFEGREILGPNMNAATFPKTARLLQGIMQDMRIMEFSIKYKYIRPRPYHLEAKLQPLTRINSPSFASGHTLWAFLQAFVWSEIVPEKQKEFIALAEEIRRSREILGIHYPSDNEASRQVAYEMVQLYFSNPEFKDDFKEAKREWQEKAATFNGQK